MAFLNMEKYESARDAFQASLKGTETAKYIEEARCTLIIPLCFHFQLLEHHDEEVKSLLLRTTIMAQMKFIPRAAPSPDVRSRNQTTRQQQYR